MNIDIDSLSQSDQGRFQVMSILDKMMDNAEMKKNELIYWSYFHNNKDTRGFDYLRKVGEFEYPALLRRIPHQRAFLNILISTQQRREWNFSASTIDIRSREEKYEKKLRKTLNFVKTATTKKIILVQEQLSQIDQQYQQIMDILQQQPENEQEAMQQQHLKESLPQLNVQMGMMKEMLNREMMLSNEDLKKIDQFFKYKYKDLKDEFIGDILVWLKKKYELQRHSTKNFASQLVTGRQYYFVDYIPGDKYPIFQRLQGGMVTYPNIEMVERVEDGPWVKIEQMWSYNDVIRVYGHLMTEDERKRLLTIATGHNTSSAFVTTDGHNAVYMANSETGKTGNGLKVTRYYWKAEKEIRAIQKPNPKSEGSYFTHFISDKKVIMSNDYTYNNQLKKWIHKQNQDLQYDAKEVEVINESRGDRLEKRYMDVRYDGVNINNTFIRSWQSPIQLRSEDDFQNVKLPVIGDTFNSVESKPFSLIGSTLGLSDTLDILFYTRELMLALQQVAGVVMDYSQKPSDWTDEEWFYQMKLGRYVIQTIKAGKQISSFNQFQAINPSGTGQALSIIDNMIVNTYDYMGEIMGIPRPRKGEVKPTDQVGTFEKSIEQSSLITEILFDDHDKIQARAFTQLSMLYVRYCMEKDTKVTVGDKDYRMVTIPGKFFDSCDVEVFIEDDGKSERQMREIKSIMKQGYDARQVTLSQFMKIYMSESIKEVERLVTYFGEENERIASQAQEADKEGKMAIIQAQAEKKFEYEAKLKQLTAQLEESQNQFKNAIEEQKLQLQANVEQSRLALESEKLQQAAANNEQINNLKLLELINEQQVETEYLRESKESRIISNRLDALGLQMEALINGVSLNLQKNKNKAEHTEKMKKIEVDAKKTDKKSPEHISDR